MHIDRLAGREGTLMALNRKLGKCQEDAKNMPRECQEMALLHAEISLSFSFYSMQADERLLVIVTSDFQHKGIEEGRLTPPSLHNKLKYGPFT